MVSVAHSRTDVREVGLIDRHPIFSETDIYTYKRIYTHINIKHLDKNQNRLVHHTNGLPTKYHTTNSVKECKKCLNYHILPVCIVKQSFIFEEKNQFTNAKETKLLALT